MTLFDDRLCILGEGAHWHPTRKQFFWFDILGKAFMSRVGDKQMQWDFDEYVSACGWIDESNFLIASQSALFQFDIESGTRTDLFALEADNPRTRSNDGRADPYGGFWIGTMGIKSEHEAGAIYRYYKGELRCLYRNISVTNTMCFTPDGASAYFCDTPTRKVMRVALDGQGWPVGDPAVYLDLTAERLNADGAVVDREGNVWIAQWGANRVAVYDKDGQFMTDFRFPASCISCPAFGGEELDQLFATSARIGVKEADLVNELLAGATFCQTVGFVGQAEHRIIL